MKQHDAFAKIKTENLAEIWVVIFFKKKFFFADVLASNEQLSKKKIDFFFEKIQKFHNKIRFGTGVSIMFFFKNSQLFATDFVVIVPQTEY